MNNYKLQELCVFDHIILLILIIINKVIILLHTYLQLKKIKPQYLYQASCYLLYTLHQILKIMFPPDQLRLIYCLLVAIPISYSMTMIKNPKLIMILSCAISAMMQMYLFQWEAPILWLQQNVVYLICRFGPRKHIGKIVLVETFTVLVILQLRRMYLSYGQQNIDITAIFMMQVFLYIGFAYNYQDGNPGNVHTTQRTIYRYPSYIQYLGYVLFVPSCIVGPVFEFQDYMNYVYRRDNYSKIKNGFSIPAMIKQFKVFIISFAVLCVLMPLKISFLITPQFAEMNFFTQAGYLLIAIIGARFKYYSAWSLGMLAVNATGITYNPKKQEDGTIVNNWDRIVVSDIWTFQMDPSMKKKADAWNIPIQLALKRYVYDRSYTPSQLHSSKKKKKLQMMAQQKTLAVSALWHGLYLGYFVSFFHWALILQVSQELFRIQKTSPRLTAWRKRLYYVELIFINYILGYFGSCFLLMTWGNIITLFKATYFIPVFTVYILNIVLVRLAIFTKHSKLQNMAGIKIDGPEVVDRVSEETANSQKDL